MTEREREMKEKIRVEFENTPTASELLRAGFEIGKMANPGDKFGLVHINLNHVYEIDIDEEGKTEGESK